MQQASRNPLLRTGCYWLGYFFARLAMHFGFRPVLRRTFAKIPLSADPAISRGHRGTATARGLGVWLSQSLTFGSLAAAFRACFLRLQKATLGSTSGKCKDVRVPFSCRTPGARASRAAGGGGPEQAVMYYTLTHRIHGAAIYGNIYHQYTPNVSIYTIHGSYGNDNDS